MPEQTPVKTSPRKGKKLSAEQKAKMLAGRKAAAAQAADVQTLTIKVEAPKASRIPLAKLRISKRPAQQLDETVKAAIEQLRAQGKTVAKVAGTLRFY